MSNDTTASPVPNPASVFTGFQWQTIVTIVISCLGTASNLINILVFINPKLSDLSYKYMLVKAIINFLHLSCATANQYVNYCFNCSWGYTYAANVYYYIVGQYIISCFAIYRILVENILSVFILSILINRNWIDPFRFRLSLVIIGLISVVYYLQRPFGYYIQPIGTIGNVTLIYKLSATQFVTTRTYQIITIVQSVVRIVLIDVSLTIINLVNVAKFHKRFKKRRRVGFFLSRPSEMNRLSTIKSNVSNSAVAIEVNGNENGRNKAVRNSKSTRNITRMVICASFMKIFLETPYSVSLIVQIVGVNSVDFYTFYLISGALLYLAQSLDFVVYYLFNNLYRECLNGYFKAIFRVFKKT